MNSVSAAARVAAHRHYLLVVVAASDIPLERLVDSSWGRRRFDEWDSVLNGYRD